MGRRIKLADLKTQAQQTMAVAQHEVKFTGAEAREFIKLCSMVISEALDGVTLKLTNHETGKAFRYGLRLELLEGDEED